jgi:hypothetical protein
MGLRDDVEVSDETLLHRQLLTSFIESVELVSMASPKGVPSLLRHPQIGGDKPLGLVNILEEISTQVPIPTLEQLYPLAVVAVDASKRVDAILHDTIFPQIRKAHSS